MKILRKELLGAAAALVLLLWPAAPVRATQIPIANGSFEANSNVWPGYGSISGWTVSNTGRVGVNPPTTGGSPPSPFADNGTIPEGIRVAFLQYYPPDSPQPVTPAISQPITGLRPGFECTLSLYVNATSQGGGCGPAGISISIDGGATTLWSDPNITQVGGSNLYHFEQVTFTPTGTSIDLVIANPSTAGGAGDAYGNVLLVDDITLTQIPEPNLVLLLGLGGLILAWRRQR